MLKYLDTAMYDGEINQILGARSVFCSPGGHALKQPITLFDGQRTQKSWSNRVKPMSPHGVLTVRVKAWC